MASSKCIFYCLASLLIFFFLTHNIASDYCRSRFGYGCFTTKPVSFRAVQSRKMLDIAMREMKMGMKNGKRSREVDWEKDELRRVPSGPDPLHHNGGSQKKPRTDP